MSTGSDNNKVVDLQQRQAAQSQQVDRVGELIKQSRGIAQKRLALLVGALFDSVDDALFDLAEKAENNSVQTKYFDGMREVRKKRQLVERLFQENLTRDFAQFGQSFVRASEETQGPAKLGLTLIADVARKLEQRVRLPTTQAEEVRADFDHLCALFATFAATYTQFLPPPTD